MKNKRMQNKRIDFFIRKERWKRDNRTHRYGIFTIIALVILVVIIAAAAFLILDTMRMEKKIAEGEAMLQDPQLLQFYQDVESLNQRESMYLSIKESLANLDVITETYPNVDRNFFNHLLLGNDPGVSISNMSYDGNSGQFSFAVEVTGYGSWTKFINKMTNSPYFTGFNYIGYQKDIATDNYYSGFSVQLVKVEDLEAKDENPEQIPEQIEEVPVTTEENPGQTEEVE